MSEPDWEQFRVSKFDGTGHVQDKLTRFMEAFMDWRRDEKNREAPPRKPKKARRVVQSIPS